MSLGKLSNYKGYRNVTFYRKIHVFEVDDALKKINNRKTFGPDNVPIESYYELMGTGNTKKSKATSVSENKFGFISRRSTMEAIHNLRNFIEKYEEKKQYLNVMFINFEKIYDRVPRDILWSLRK